MIKIGIGFGKRVHERRKSLGMTQAELRRKTALSAGFISDVENDKRQVSATTLYYISRALGVGMEELFVGEVERRSTAPSFGRGRIRAGYTDSNYGDAAKGNR